MTGRKCRQGWLGACLCLLMMAMGCQTWEGGMTLPSPHYLTENVDYIPKKPVYGHANELQQMERAYAERFGPGAGVLPPP